MQDIILTEERIHYLKTVVVEEWKQAAQMSSAQREIVYNRYTLVEREIVTKELWRQSITG